MSELESNESDAATCNQQSRMAAEAEAQRAKKRERVAQLAGVILARAWLRDRYGISQNLDGDFEAAKASSM